MSSAPHDDRIARSILDALPMPVAYVGRDRSVGLVNAAYARWRGVAAGEIVGRGARDLLGDGHDALRDAIETALAGTPIALSIRVAGADGPRDCDLRCVPHREGDGEVAGVLAIVDDASERALSDREHRTAHERFETVTAAVSGVVYEIDPETQRAVRSHGMRELVGIAPEHADPGVGWWLSRIHPDDLAAHREAVERARARRAPGYELRYRVRHRDEHWVHVGERAFFTWEGDRLVRHVGLLDDVGERVRQETDQARVNAELEAARREAVLASRAKDEFLAMLGHELRNPLAPIVLALGLMRRSGGDAFERERAVIERQVAHLTRLVDDLLDVSRIAGGKIAIARAPVEMADVVARALETAGPWLEKKAHRLEVDVPRGAVVLGDLVRLSQVLSNLLVNAAKYTPERGHIRVRAERRDRDVVVAIADDGVGIPPEMLPLVFERFVQAPQSFDRAHGGLGLGLAIVRSIVELHGGRVEAFSAGDDRGTEIVMHLPASDTAPSEPPPASVPLRADARTVLVVDDSEDSAEMMATTLRAAGHRVEIALDALEALARLETFVPDVALLDIGLPALDGYELARRIRADPRLGAVRLIAVTGYGEDQDRARSEEAGFEGHVVKPVDLALVEQLVRRRRRTA